VMIGLGKGLPRPLVSASWVSRCDLLIVDATVFGTPILLKRKADKIPVEAAPLPSQPSHPHQPSPPPPVAKCPRRDQEIVNRMCGLLRTGARWMDTL